MGNNRPTLQPENYYHLYNHGNGNENIFRSNENYIWFLKRYNDYISPIANTFAYCLMPNHFHFLIQIKSNEQIQDYYQLKQKTKSKQAFEADKFISQCFSNFLNSYAKAFNKMYNRKGSLFLNNMQRKAVNNDGYFTKLIHYIHANPVHHGFVNSVEIWQHSSYHILLSKKPTKLQRDAVLNWYGNIDEFKRIHQTPVAPKIDFSFE